MLQSSKYEVHLQWGEPAFSGRVPENLGNSEFEIYMRYPSDKYWTSDRSAWVVLYDDSGKVKTATDDWSTLPDKEGAEVRRQFREFQNRSR